MLAAAIDLGTNNCRLLIARGTGADGFAVTDAFSRIVRLGENLGATGLLSDAAQKRTLSALAVCAEKMARHNVKHYRAVATEACRSARNGAEFLACVKAETGLTISPITGEEEARLALAGCAPLLIRNKPHALMFDIGGGSTELLWLRVEDQNGANSGSPRFDILDQTSLPIGIAALTEKYGTGRLTPTRYREMVNEIASAIAPFASRNSIAAEVSADRVQLLGSSGTITTLAALHRNLTRYRRELIDGSQLAVVDARAVIGKLLELDYEERVALPCLGCDRADLVIAGCAVLEAICDVCPVPAFRIGDRGLREGMLYELFAAAEARGDA